MKRSTQENVIKKFKDKHGDKYDYSKVVYIKDREKVEIVCKEHGVFKQTPNNHIRGQGCYHCGVISTSNSKRKKIIDILTCFEKAHGNRYDYSLVDYKGITIKVKIKCKTHGIFEQTPDSHISGKGCNKCGIISSAQKTKSTTYQFIEKSKLIHCDKYSYDKTVYKNNHTKVIIECKLHGEFMCSPGNHLKRRGCPYCATESRIKHKQINPYGWTPQAWERSAKISKNFDSFKVYVIKCYNETECFYKIGRTFKIVKSRFINKKLMPYNYEVLHEFIFDNAREAFDYEAKLKREHKQFKYLPLISFDGKFECFTEVDLDRHTKCHKLELHD